MGRYIKKFGRIGYALGPSEERGFALWVGYDIEGVDDDLSHAGLEKVDGWDEERLTELGVTTFVPVTLEKLGIER
ncbi:MAG TPA: hypothetical protein VGF69_18085 [Thermoanaerobaculia bacterium]|jgi:hypothetical protein